VPGLPVFAAASLSFQTKPRQGRMASPTPAHGAVGVAATHRTQCFPRTRVARLAPREPMLGHCRKYNVFCRENGIDM